MPKCEFTRNCRKTLNTFPRLEKQTDAQYQNEVEILTRDLFTICYPALPKLNMQSQLDSLLTVFFSAAWTFEHEFNEILFWERLSRFGPEIPMVSFLTLLILNGTPVPRNFFHAIQVEKLREHPTTRINANRIEDSIIPLTTIKSTLALLRENKIMIRSNQREYLNPNVFDRFFYNFRHHLLRYGTYCHPTTLPNNLVRRGGFKFEGSPQVEDFCSGILAGIISKLSSGTFLYTGHIGEIGVEPPPKCKMTVEVEERNQQSILWIKTLENGSTFQWVHRQLFNDLHTILSENLILLGNEEIILKCKESHYFVTLGLCKFLENKDDGSWERKIEGMRIFDVN